MINIYNKHLKQWESTLYFAKNLLNTFRIVSNSNKNLIVYHTMLKTDHEMLN